MYRASVERGHGETSVWIHLVAYGAGRAQLAAVAADVERKLDAALRP